MHKNRLQFVLVSFFCMSLLILILSNSLPFNPLKKSFLFENKLKIFLPESWGFFTRNPREDKVYVYKLKGGSLEFADKQRNSSSINFFGVKRNSKKYAIEMSTIINQLESIGWE